MNSNVMINSEAFENYITKFDAKLIEIKTTLTNLSNTMKEIDGNNDTWKSKTAVAVHESFSEIESHFEEVDEELNVFSLFLKDVLEDYKNEEEREEKRIDTNDSYLDVNE